MLCSAFHYVVLHYTIMFYLTFFLFAYNFKNIIYYTVTFQIDNPNKTQKTTHIDHAVIYCDTDKPIITDRPHK